MNLSVCIIAKNEEKHIEKQEKTIIEEDLERRENTIIAILLDNNKKIFEEIKEQIKPEDFKNEMMKKHKVILLC